MDVNTNVNVHLSRDHLSARPGPARPGRTVDKSVIDGGMNAALTSGPALGSRLSAPALRWLGWCSLLALQSDAHAGQASPSPGSSSRTSRADRWGGGGGGGGGAGPSSAGPRFGSVAALQSDSDGNELLQVAS